MKGPWRVLGVRNFIPLYGPIVSTLPLMFVRVLLLLACMFAAAQCYHGNCTLHTHEPVIVVSPSGSTVLTLFGDRGSLDSAYHGVVYPESLRIDIGLLGIAERNKTIDATGALTTCLVPSGFDTLPNDTTRNGKPVAPIVRYWDISELDCYMYTYEKHINNTRIVGAGARYSTPQMPDMYFALSYEFAENEIRVLSSNDTEFTSGIPYYYHWQPDRLKATMRSHGVEWSPVPQGTTNETTTFLSLHFEVAMLLQKGGNGTLVDEMDSTKMSYQTASQAMSFEFEKTFVVDDIPYANEAYSDVPPIILNAVENDFTISAGVGIALCHSHFGQWNHSVYDPQLSVLFSVPPITDAPPSPSAAAAKKQSNVVKIVAPVVVVSVVAIAAVLALVIWSTPSLQAKFLPSRFASTHTTEENSSYHKPKSPTSHASLPPSASDSNTQSAGWTKSKPSTM